VDRKTRGRYNICKCECSFGSIFIYSFAPLLLETLDLLQGLQASKGKALTLLTLFNHLLRQTSYIMVNFKSSTNVLLLRARIHLFIAEWYKLNDMSGVNLRGEYSELRTRWPGLDGTEDDEQEEETVEIPSQPEINDVELDKPAEIPANGEAAAPLEDPLNTQAEATGSTAIEVDKAQSEADAVKASEVKQSDRMEVDVPEEPVKIEDEGVKVEDLYAALYHVQLVFTNPPSLIGDRPGVVRDTVEVPMEAFKRRTGIILEEMVKRRAEAVDMAKSMREVALAGSLADLRSDEYPAFLVSRRTLSSAVSLPKLRCACTDRMLKHI
jgi:THO complex subunit 1